jgi:hypothetical protein
MRDLTAKRNPRSHSQNKDRHEHGLEQSVTEHKLAANSLNKEKIQ